MIEYASHAWVTRTLFPKGGDSQRNQYIIQFDDPTDEQKMGEDIYELLADFVNEIGGYWSTNPEVERGRYLLEGPKGFTIVEVAPAYTEEEYNKITGEQTLDLTVWERMFKANLPQEPTPETGKSE